MVWPYPIHELKAVQDKRIRQLFGIKIDGLVVAYPPALVLIIEVIRVRLDRNRLHEITNGVEDATMLQVRLTMVVPDLLQAAARLLKQGIFRAAHCFLLSKVRNHREISVRNNAR